MRSVARSRQKSKQLTHNVDIWAVIYEPSYRPAEPGEELVLEEDLNTIRLEDPDVNGTYRGVYPAFSEIGDLSDRHLC